MNFTERQLIRDEILEKLFCGDYSYQMPKVLTRVVRHGDSDYLLQHNPARAVSSSAKIDSKSLASRPCFLCRNNRPANQPYIEWADGEIEILRNPFPVLPGHLTMVTKIHTAQSIKTLWPYLYELCKTLDKHVIFYNGPKCGASAPDHAHLQAVLKDTLPLYDNRFSRYKICDGYQMLIDDNRIVKRYVLNKVTEEVPSFLMNGEEERMINLFATIDIEDRLVLDVAYRSNHRPNGYPDVRLISPGAIDMAGLLICPRLCDYEELTGDEVTRIYRDVSL